MTSWTAEEISRAGAKMVRDNCCPECWPEPARVKPCGSARLAVNPARLTLTIPATCAAGHRVVLFAHEARPSRMKKLYYQEVRR